MKSREELPKVLISAFACEPDKGSEPAVGWNWSMNLAEHVRLTVLTREAHRESIDAWLKQHPEAVSAHRVEFIYYDPPSLFCKSLDSGYLSFQMMYILWQIGAYFRVRKGLKNYDILHHVTYNTLMFSGVWWTRKCKVVLGPLGGTSTVPNKLKGLYGKETLISSVREFLINHWRWIPWVRLSLYFSDRIYCANSQTLDILTPIYGDRCKMMLETGIDENELVSCNVPTFKSTPLEILWVGALVKRKALTLAIQAIQRLSMNPNLDEHAVLVIVGDGDLMQASKALVDSLGVSENVRFLGRVDYLESKRCMQECDIFLFTSVNDTSGNVILEAMSAGKPIVCLNHQGAKDITTNKCAIRVEVGTEHDTVKGISESLMRLCGDPVLRKSMGLAGQDRVKRKYLWRQKAKSMAYDYHELLKLI